MTSGLGPKIGRFLKRTADKASAATDAAVAATRGRPEFDWLQFPHPYATAVAFVTDIDGTSFPGLTQTHRCFYGMDPAYDGVELELANSFWIMAAEQKNMRNSIYMLELDGTERPHVRDRLLPFLKSPLFDTMHSYGDFKKKHYTRERAERCVEYMLETEVTPQLWTYHGSPQEGHNIWVDSDNWTGDDPTSEYYHLDLLSKTPLRYYRFPPSLELKNDRVTQQVVQARDGTPLLGFSSHAFIDDPADPERVRAWMDQIEADGRLKVQFRRIFRENSNSPNRLMTWHPELLWLQLGDDVLNGAVDGRRALYITQHLSRTKSLFNYAEEQTQTAMRKLSDRQRDGQILVTGTARLVTFEFVRDNLPFDASMNNDTLVIKIAPNIEVNGYTLTLSEDDLQGIGLTVGRDERVVFEFAGRQLATESIIEGDNQIVQVPWQSRVEAQRAALTEFEATFGTEDG